MINLIKQLLILVLIGFWMVFRIVKSVVLQISQDFKKWIQKSFKMELMNIAKELNRLAGDVSDWSRGWEVSKPIQTIEIFEPLGIPSKPKKSGTSKKGTGTKKSGTAKKATGTKKSAPQKSKAKKSPAKKSARKSSKM